MAEFEDEGSLNLNETVAALVGFLRRRRWAILLPFAGITLSTIAGLSFIPNRYTSTATLLVVQQQVPQRYVVPNSETNVASALQAMKQEVLSRTQLLRLINDFGLYSKQRKRLAPEELVSLMLGDIGIAPIEETPQKKDIDAFKISFDAESPLVAQQVTNTLTSLFINEYLRNGAEQATNTTTFLHQQVEEKGKALELQEERLRDFKLQHVGELPEQQSGNLGILTGLQGQLQNTMVSLNRAQQQRAFLQAQLQATPRRRVVGDLGLPTSVAGSPVTNRLLASIDSAQNDLARLEDTRSSLLSKGYTSAHPDVARNQRDIAQMEDKIRRLRAVALADTPPPAPTTTATASSIDPSDDPAVAQLKGNLEANRLEIENLTSEEARLKGVIAQYEMRINQTPVREQQEAGIKRDTEVLRQQYGELQKKEQESQLATNLQRQQGGQQFRLIDPASLPSLPSSPKRIKISLGGFAGGLCIGFVLAVLMEMRDTSFHSEKELTKHLAPPFVLGIPVLPTPHEIHWNRWRLAFQWMAASAMVLTVLAAEFYVYRRG